MSIDAYTKYKFILYFKTLYRSILFWRQYSEADEMVIHSGPSIVIEDVLLHDLIHQSFQKYDNKMALVSHHARSDIFTPP